MGGDSRKEASEPNALAGEDVAVATAAAASDDDDTTSAAVVEIWAAVLLMKEPS